MVAVADAPTMVPPDEQLPDVLPTDRLNDRGMAVRPLRDDLRRKADAGHNFSDVMGQFMGSGLAELSLAALQLEWAERFASKPAHLSFGVSSRGSPAHLRMTDDSGNAGAGGRTFIQK